MRNLHAMQWILFHGLPGLAQDEQHTENGYEKTCIKKDVIREAVFTKIAITEQKLTKGD